MEDFIHALNKYISRFNPYARVIYKKSYEPTTINMYRKFLAELFIRIPDKKPVRFITVQQIIPCNHPDCEQVIRVEMISKFIEYSQTEEFKELMNGIAVQQIPVNNRAAEPQQ